MKRVVLADSHEVFRAGLAQTIATRDEYRIVAHCSNSTRLLQAISTFPRCVAIVATCLKPDLNQLRSRLLQTGSQAIAVVEHGETAVSSSETFLGVVSRNVAPLALLDCLRSVAQGCSWTEPELAGLKPSCEDTVGIRVCRKLTKREMRVAALLLEGCKNREMSLRLGKSEQVIKNCFRNIYDKSGMSDRLELALFIHRHRELAKAVASAAEEIKAEELSAAYSIAVA